MAGDQGEVLILGLADHTHHTSEQLFFVGQQKDDGEWHAEMPGTVSVRVVWLGLGKGEDTHANDGEDDARRHAE